MNNILWSYASPVIIVIVLFVLFCFTKVKRFFLANLSIRIFNFSVLGFSYFGLTLGLFVGLSSTAALSAVLPALLTFIGGIMTYYFFSANNEYSENQTLSMLALICISVYLSIGAYQGIRQRRIYDAAQKELDFDKEKELKSIDFDFKQKLMYLEDDIKKGKNNKPVSLDQIKNDKNK